eukprot:702690-Rhodomonas_salina.1
MAGGEMDGGPAGGERMWADAAWMTGYGAIEGSAPQESRSRVPKALIGGALAVVAVVAVVLGYASSSAHVSLPAERLQMVELPGEAQERSHVELNQFPRIHGTPPSNDD